MLELSQNLKKQLSKDSIRQGEFGRYILNWDDSRLSLFLNCPQNFPFSSRNSAVRLNAIKNWLDDENRVKNFETAKNMAISEGLQNLQFAYLEEYCPLAFRKNKLMPMKRKTRNSSISDSLTSFQKQELTNAFTNCSYLEPKTIEILSEKLEMSFEAISDWFDSYN